jgi:hypothetical protein
MLLLWILLQEETEQNKWKQNQDICLGNQQLLTATSFYKKSFTRSIIW